MTEHKFTDEEIIKALECCCKDNYEGDCPKCPLQLNGNCNVILAEHALYLINSQKAEVDELKLRNERQRYVIHTYHINEIRKAAVKEFVEAYKEEIVRRYEDIAYRDLFFNVLDDLANKVDE